MDSLPHCRDSPNPSPEPTPDSPSEDRKSPPAPTTITENKFCIDSLLRPASASSQVSPTRQATPPTLRGVPLFPPGLYPPGAPGFSFPPASDHGGSSENSPTTTSPLESAFKASNCPSSNLNLQTMQLEWLARTGMLYHRFPELAGMVSVGKIHYPMNEASS